MIKPLISARALSLVRFTSCVNVPKVLSVNFSRNIFLSASCKDKETANEDKSDKLALGNQHDGYNEFYRFPYIRVGHYLHKLKWYQTLSTVAAVPISSLLYLSEKIHLAEMQTLLLSGIFLTVNLHAWATLFHEAVGFMYLSEDEKTVKISYLNLWGNRVNKEFPVGEIMLLSEMPESFTDVLFRRVIFYTTNSPKPKLYLSIRSMQLGVITDEESFTKVFGSVKN